MQQEKMQGRKKVVPVQQTYVLDLFSLQYFAEPTLFEFSHKIYAFETRVFY